MYFTPRNEFKICTDAEYMGFISDVTANIESISQDGMFKSYDNKDLYYRYIQVENAKASIVILHGYTEFIQKYYEPMWYFINSGYNVFIYDMRGHGQSFRETEDQHLAHVNSFDSYVKDLHCFCDQVVIPNSDGKPLYIFSHSMGGAVGLLYLGDHPGVFEKSVFCSPMVTPYTYGAPAFYVNMHIAIHGRRNGWDTKFTYAGTWNPNPDYTKSADQSFNRFESNMNIRRSSWRYQNSSSTFTWMKDVMKLKKRILNRKFVDKIDSKVLIMAAGRDRNVILKDEIALSKMLKDCDFYLFEDSKHTIYTGSDENIKLFYEKTLNHFSN